MKLTDRFTPVTLRTANDNLADDVRRGLSAAAKSLPCKFFYDEAGSKLFERICEVPEYYLPRVETAILEKHASDIVAYCPAGLSLVELGCGNSRKTQLLIETILARQPQLAFFAIDIAPECLEKGANRLLAAYPPLAVVGLVGEFADGLDYLAAQPGGPRLVLFLGSTVGNFDERELDDFLAMVRRNLRPHDRFLLGVDLLKDPRVLIAAYDDSAGVTAEFNLNIFARLNRELDADFDLAQFRHCAVFNTERSRIEMHLVSVCDQRVSIGSIGLDVHFHAGETIHTENCYKHSQQAFAAALARHGFEVVRAFTDFAQQFCHFLVR